MNYDKNSLDEKPSCLIIEDIRQSNQYDTTYVLFHNKDILIITARPTAYFEEMIADVKIYESKKKGYEYENYYNGMQSSKNVNIRDFRYLPPAAVRV